ncbi:E3 ubiquitin/ISG15 ligase TRIM25-like [Mustelus asterias]
MENSQAPAGLSQVMCDYCIDDLTAAAKTCLKCESSFCDRHLQPHLHKKTFSGHILTEPVSDLSSWQCPDHKEFLQFYCKDDAECVCSCCIIIGKHKSHILLSLDQIQGAIKEELNREIKKLWGVLQNCSSKQQDLERIEAEIKTQINELKGKLSENFSEWKRKLDEDEESSLKLIDEEAHQVLSQIRSCSETLNKRMEQITLIDGETQSLVQRDCLSLIQNSKQLLSRLTETQRVTDLDVPVLTLNLSNVSQHIQKRLSELEKYHSNILKIIMPSFTKYREPSDVTPPTHSSPGAAHVPENILQLSTGIIRGAGISQGKRSLTLDANTANCNLILSDDLRSATWTEQKQPYLPHPERFKHHPQVLCTQSFSSGSLSWDVKTSGDYWRIGIVCGNMEREGLNSHLGNNSNSWGLCFYGGNFLRACHNYQPIFIQEFPSQSRIRVLLDYEAGTVSFYQVTSTVTHLHTFQTKFIEPVFPAFCCWEKSLKLIN